MKVAVQNQAKGISTGIAGTSVLGEVLACPSASDLNGIHALLLDCTDVVRIDRIRARDGIDSTLASQDMLCWAAWLRMHASDPQWRQDVIRSQGEPGMEWERWTSWMKGDARWKVSVLDNSFLSVEQTTSALVGWANEHPINQAWCSPLDRRDCLGGCSGQSCLSRITMAIYTQAVSAGKESDASGRHFDMVWGLEQVHSQCTVLHRQSNSFVTVKSR